MATTGSSRLGSMGLGLDREGYNAQQDTEELNLLQRVMPKMPPAQASALDANDRDALGAPPPVEKPLGETAPTGDAEGQRQAADAKLQAALAKQQQAAADRQAKDAEKAQREQERAQRQQEREAAASAVQEAQGAAESAVTPQEQAAAQEQVSQAQAALQQAEQALQAATAAAQQAAAAAQAAAQVEQQATTEVQTAQTEKQQAEQAAQQQQAQPPQQQPQQPGQPAQQPEEDMVTRAVRTAAERAMRKGLTGDKALLEFGSEAYRLERQRQGLSPEVNLTDPVEAGNFQRYQEDWRGVFLDQQRHPGEVPETPLVGPLRAILSGARQGAQAAPATNPQTQTGVAQLGATTGNTAPRGPIASVMPRPPGSQPQTQADVAMLGAQTGNTAPTPTVAQGLEANVLSPENQQATTRVAGQGPIASVMPQAPSTPPEAQATADPFANPAPTRQPLSAGAQRPGSATQPQQVGGTQAPVPGPPAPAPAPTLERQVSAVLNNDPFDGQPPPRPAGGPPAPLVIPLPPGGGRVNAQGVGEPLPEPNIPSSHRQLWSEWRAAGGNGDWQEFRQHAQRVGAPDPAWANALYGARQAELGARNTLQEVGLTDGTEPPGTALQAGTGALLSVQQGGSQFVQASPDDLVNTGNALAAREAWAEPALHAIARLAWAQQTGSDDPAQAPDDYVNVWTAAFRNGDLRIPRVAELTKQMNDMGVRMDWQKPTGDYTWLGFWGKNLAPKQEQNNDCGPAAAVGIMRAIGLDAPVNAVYKWAVSNGYHNGREFNGPAQMSVMLRNLGADANPVQNIDWATVRAEVEAGRPVVLSSTAHYYLATGFNAQTGKFYVGNTGRAVGRGDELAPGEMNYNGSVPNAMITLRSLERGPQQPPSFAQDIAPRQVATRTAGASRAAVDGAPVADSSRTGRLKEVEAWHDLAAAAAAKHGVPESIVKTIMDIESRGDPNAGSPQGATGLMQVMPREAGAMFRDRPTRKELLDPATNVDYGTKMLADLYRQWGSWEKAAAGYLGGLDSRGNYTNATDAHGTDGRTYARLLMERRPTYQAR